MKGTSSHTATTPSSLSFWLNQHLAHSEIAQPDVTISRD
jgi:hypothetical protein